MPKEISVLNLDAIGAFLELANLVDWFVRDEIEPSGKFLSDVFLLWFLED